MKIEQRFYNVAIVGAAGKMGSGIALLLAQEMAWQKLVNPQANYQLHLIDNNDAGLEGLWHYIDTQIVKDGEKRIGQLRELCRDRADLVENGEIIQHYVKTALSLLRPATNLATLAKSSLVFEAIIEDEAAKVAIFKKIKAFTSADTYFFTNTSSVPIRIIDIQAGLDGRLAGFHFYNPPAVQKLAELIWAPQTRQELKDLALDIAEKLRKKVIIANDIAGFIGNGHFIRDGLHALTEARRLEKEYGQAQAIYLINKVSQDLLVRPMGIFQLLDYVGIDVFHYIQKVMDRHLPEEDLTDAMIAEMLAHKVVGGQRSDGSQKNGFLQYEKNRPVGVYNMASGKYQLFADNKWSASLDNALGSYPAGWAPWKNLLGDAQLPAKLAKYFAQLKSLDTLGSRIALAYLRQSKQIGEKLVQTGVAQSAQDVNGVLSTGFFHLYGPINDYV